VDRKNGRRWRVHALIFTAVVHYTAETGTEDAERLALLTVLGAQELGG
jgi:hypothetical protein